MRGETDEIRVERHFSYLEESRRLSLSIAFILPLMVLYHIGIIQSGSAVRNMAEVWMTGPISAIGIPAAQALNIAIIAALVVAFWKLQRTGAACLAFALLMLVESAVYALAMYHGVGVLTEAVQQEAERFLAFNTGRWTPLFLALGAGVYEELLFRFLLIGGGMLVLQKFFLWNRAASAGVALAVASVVFALVHYIGPFGDTFDTFSFLFRTIAGAALGLIFLIRGLGIAVWTHSLYNVMVLMSRLETG